MKVTVLKLKKKVHQVIGGDSNRMSCRQVFKNYNILTFLYTN
jgi:hypothetical protein